MWTNPSLLSLSQSHIEIKAPAFLIPDLTLLAISVNLLWHLWRQTNRGSNASSATECFVIRTVTSSLVLITQRCYKNMLLKVMGKEVHIQRESARK